MMRLMNLLLPKAPRLVLLIAGMWEGLLRNAGVKPRMAFRTDYIAGGLPAMTRWYVWRNWRYELWAEWSIVRGTRISARARQYYEKSENSVAQLQSL